MSDWVDRLARAMYEKEASNSPYKYEGADEFFRWDGPNFKGQDYWRGLARTALKELSDILWASRNSSCEYVADGIDEELKEIANPSRT
jgi:hypothetical protein